MQIALWRMTIKMVINLYVYILYTNIILIFNQFVINENSLPYYHFYYITLSTKAAGMRVDRQSR